MRPRRKLFPLAAAGLFAAGLPAPASAHLVATGLGPVYDGAGHWLLSPEDFAPVLALALFAGLRGPAAGRRALFLLPPAWLLGGLLGLLPAVPPEFSRPVLSAIVAATFLVPGLLAAADFAVPVSFVAVIVVLLGLTHGVLDAFGLRAEGATAAVCVLQFLGMAGVLFVFVALFSALVISLRAEWLRIAVRVLGSWIAAAGLLLLGWALNGHG
jgi:hypothetical protein